MCFRTCERISGSEPFGRVTAQADMKTVVEWTVSDLTEAALRWITRLEQEPAYRAEEAGKAPVVLRVLDEPEALAGIEAWLCNIPGLKVVMPSTPHDASGLLKSAIYDDSPVVFLEQKVCAKTRKTNPGKNMQFRSERLM